MITSHVHPCRRITEGKFALHAASAEMPQQSYILENAL